MKKNSGQILILVLFIIIIFVGVTIAITTLTTRELEMREMEETALKIQYAAESGLERARYYIKENNPISLPVTINKVTSPTDKNPLDNGYSYTTVITPNGQVRPNGLTCNIGAGDYCIDSRGESPQ